MKFSIHEGGRPLTVMVSPELRERLDILSNALEMNRSSLCRFIINRGVDQLEAKLVERIDVMRRQAE